MPQKEIIVQGQKFNATVPYEAGHTLNEAEARALNQLRCENLRNNFANQVKAFEAKSEGAAQTFEELAARFADYDDKYTFNMPSAGGGATRRMDPVEREARAIAADIIRAHLAKSGRKVKDVKESNPEGYEEKLEEIAARDDVLKLARSRVNSKQKLLEGISLDDEPQAQAAE